MVENKLLPYDKENNTFRGKQALAIVGTDFDDTYGEKNKLAPRENEEFTNKVQNEFGVIWFSVTGKPLPYMEKVIKIAQIDYIAGENGGVFKQRDKDMEIIGGNIEDLHKIRKHVGLNPTQEGVQEIILDGKKGQVAIEEGKYGVFTIFSEIEPIKHRWTFTQAFDRDLVAQALENYIKSENLSLSILGPHADGAVDVLRLDEKGNPIDKRYFSTICCQKISPLLPRCFMGDAFNDQPAWENDNDVLAITFPVQEKNIYDLKKVKARKEVMKSVRAKGEKGIITSLNSLEGGIFEAFILLSKKQFFGEKSGEIGEFSTDYLSHYLRARNDIQTRFFI